MKIKYIIISLIILLLAGLIVFRINKNATENDKNNSQKSKPTIVVDGIVANLETFANTISITGSLEANENIELRSEVSGIVKGIYFTEGKTVSKGQVLVKVDDIELKAQLQQAKTRENLTSENERRAKLLLDKEAISQEEYDIASADYRTAKAQTQLIQSQIQKTSIVAPFSGTIGLRNISPGSYITPTIVIAKLVNNNPLKLTFSLPEKYASQIKQNTEIDFKVPNLDASFKAKIYAIDSEIDVTTRTLKVRALTNNENGKLLPGTFATINLALSNIPNTILVPTEAILPVQDGKKVYITNNGKAKSVFVETLTRNDKNIVITSGIEQGDTIVISGLISIKDESNIKVKIK
jgi:membrane fusion protein (multidrug efflux system)